MHWVKRKETWQLVFAPIPFKGSTAPPLPHRPAPPLFLSSLTPSRCCPFFFSLLQFTVATTAGRSLKFAKPTVTCVYENQFNL